MKKRLIASAAALAVASAGPALAESYWSVNVGAAFPPDQEIDGTFTDGALNEIPYAGEARFDPGFFGSLAWGHVFAPRNRSGFGVEIEGFYNALNPENFTFGGIDFDPNVPDEEEFFVGGASMFGGLVNGVYHIRSDSPLSARIGGGVGYGRISYDIDNAFEDGDGALVYQGFVGVGYAMTDNLELQLNGRYLGASDAEFEDGDFYTEAQFDTLAATIGLVWRY